MMSINDCIEKVEIINQIPGLFTIMDTQSRFLSANETALKWTGFKSQDTIVSKTYHHAPCKIAELHDEFSKQDTMAREHPMPIKMLCYLNYADGWKILFGEKYPLKNNEDIIIGSVSHFNDITHCNLIDLSKFLKINFNNKNFNINRQQICYILEDGYSSLSLTPRQSECIFFLLRGKTFKEIAKLLDISPRTVENYIEQIKYKLNCSSKTELIEKAISHGYMNILPKSFLNQS